MDDSLIFIKQNNCVCLCSSVHFVDIFSSVLCLLSVSMSIIISFPSFQQITEICTTLFKALVACRHIWLAPLISLYSDVPDRSFLYYEWFEQRVEESAKDFNKRKKIETADHIKWFYIKDIEKRSVLDAFSVKQRMLQLKFHKYYELSGKLEIKV